jgi:hypothetical protein
VICQTDHGGSIDPNPYVDPASGNLYLLWKSDDNSQRRPTNIWGQQLSANGLSLATGTSPALLLTESSTPTWQYPAIEGPTMIRNGGSYYLFYGASRYDSTESGIGYAMSSSVLGSFADQSASARWFGTTGGAQGPQGPQGPSIFTDQFGMTRMAFAAWYGKVIGYPGGVRSLWIGTFSFTMGTPSLN